MIETSHSIGGTLLKKGKWLYILGYIIAPLGYFIKIMISSNLEVHEVGILYGILSLITLISAFSDFGMTESIKYFIPRYVTEKRNDKIKSILTYAFLIQIVTGIIIACIFIFGSSFLSTYYFKSKEAEDILKIFSLFFLGINFFQVFNTFFLSVQNTLYFKITEGLRMLCTAIFVFYIYTINGSIIEYSIAWICGLYVGILFLLFFFIKKYWWEYFAKEKVLWEKKLFMEVFKYALLVLLGAQASTILSQIDMQLVIYLLGAKDAGYYTNYLSMITIPFFVLGPIFPLLFPIFSEMHSKGEIKKIESIKKMFKKDFISLTIACSIFFFTFAKTIAFAFFGEKFIFSGVIVQYSILFLSFNFLLQLNFNLMAGMGRVKERVKIMVSAIVINSITATILIEIMGVTGAALATGMGWVFIWYQSEILLKNHFNAPFDLQNIGKNIILFILTGVASYVVFTPIFIHNSRVLELLLLCGIALIWGIIFYFANKKDLYIIMADYKKIRNG